MASGPRAGLAEIHVPDLQPGSSIMPGKVNPVIPEALSMVCAQVIGNDAAVAFGGAAGNFELNIMLPMLARNVLESIRLLASASVLFADRCVSGITADEARTLEFAEGSPAVATALNPVLGYEEVASIAKQALAERKAIRDVVLERGHVDKGTITLEDLDRLLDVAAMTHQSG
jgi:fumarate hydratase class II